MNKKTIRIILEIVGAIVSALLGGGVATML
jgi:hypothetical protein